MRIQVALALLAGWVVLLPSQSSAQTCTVGPFTSSTSLSSLSSSINSAPNGAVVCLQRGQNWSAGSGLSIGTSHPDGSRVTICSSTSGQCSDSGAANARLSISGGSCVAFSSNSGGYYVKNLDCYQTDGANAANAWGIGQRVHDITIEGGVVDGFFRAVFTTEGRASVLPYNIRFGLCGGPGHWVEVRGGPTTMPNGDRHSWYGSVINAHISTWVHNFVSAGGSHINTSHMHDIGGGDGAWNEGQHDITIECGLYQVDATAANNIGAVLLKLNRGYNWVIRDNTFQVVNGNYSVNSIGFSSHAAGGTEGISGGGVPGAGGQVYRNVFDGMNGVWNEIAADLDVFNNVFIYANPDSGGVFGVIRYAYQAAASDDMPITNNRVFNNTVYFNSDANSWGLLGSDNPGTPTRPLPTNLQLYNNLVYHTGHNGVNSGAQVFESNCARFGTNGANIRNNFVYTPNDSTPSLWSGCSGASGNSASPYNVNPGLANPANGSFSLTASSPLVGKGIGAGAPLDDFAKNTRPKPPSIGAYDLGTGAAPALEPPVLIQISTTN